MPGGASMVGICMVHALIEGAMNIMLSGHPCGMLQGLLFVLLVVPAMEK